MKDKDWWQNVIWGIKLIKEEMMKQNVEIKMFIEWTDTRNTNINKSSYITMYQEYSEIVETNLHK